MNLTDFHSRSISNTPKKLYLRLPNGIMSEEYFEVVGIDSDVMLAAKAENRRLHVENAKLDVPDPDLSEKRRIPLIANAVVGWSFKEDLSKEHVEHFLHAAPHILEDLEGLVYDRLSFFGGAVTPPSSNTAESSST